MGASGASASICGLLSKILVVRSTRYQGPTSPSRSCAFAAPKLNFSEIHALQLVPARSPWPAAAAASAAPLHLASAPMTPPRLPSKVAEVMKTRLTLGAHAPVDGLQIWFPAQPVGALQFRQPSPSATQVCTRPDAHCVAPLLP